MSRKTTKSASNTSAAAKKPTITKRFTAVPPAAVAAPAAPAAATATAVAEAPAVVAAPVAPAAPAVDAGRLAELTGDLRRLDADLASAAAVALGDMLAPAAVDALIEVALNESNYFHGVVRAAAADALARQGDARAVPALIAAVRDPMAEASAEAVRALATLGDARAVAALAEVVRNADGYFLPVVRLAAVKALAKFDDAGARQVRAGVAADAAEDAVIRQAAA